ncbi:hypothetical protein BU25DRAFT_424110 [Macroventuria anomochaeta]|uniref:Uncharacterized protein n=1 Tax=Macroventuria anomochaeta TaxID=301207 RepID=A0ACB6RQZ9_9PLEO|nr:uncharacterized protein BU25DRAFT_424110 [Macroventuria anomochaeta]KAF2624316.1 hypothetical protein BU25DRAFT_424110 [Macroventuria anomochaeta]
MPYDPGPRYGHRRPLLPQSLKALVFSRVIGMDLLMVLSTRAAYVFSVVSFGYMIAGKPLSTGEFFDAFCYPHHVRALGRVAGSAEGCWIGLNTILANPTAILVYHKGQDKDVDTRFLQYGRCFQGRARLADTHGWHSGHWLV